jgi:hypothetical protein
VYASTSCTHCNTSTLCSAARPALRAAHKPPGHCSGKHELATHKQSVLVPAWPVCMTDVKV